MRTTVASCAALEGFSVDRLDDVRLFADECFNAATALGATELAMTVRPTDGRIVIDVVAPTSDPAASDGATLQMLEQLATVLAPDAHMVHADGLSIVASIDRLPA